MKTIDEMLDEVAKNLKVNKKPSGAAAQTKAQNPGSGKKTECREQKNVSEKTGCKKDCKKSECSCGGSNFKKYTGLTLDFAKEISYCIEKGAKAMGINVVVSVVNSGANPILLNAMDDSYIISAKAAWEKAYTAMALKMPTDIALKESRGGSLDGLTGKDGISLIPGGRPLESGGRIYGAVGVSGGSTEQDKILSLIGSVYFDARMKL